MTCAPRAARASGKNCTKPHNPWLCLLQRVGGTGRRCNVRLWDQPRGLSKGWAAPRGAALSLSGRPLNGGAPLVYGRAACPEAAMTYAPCASILTPPRSPVLPSMAIIILFPTLIFSFSSRQEPASRKAGLASPARRVPRSGNTTRMRLLTQNLNECLEFSSRILVSPVGIEPTTPRLKVSCSTD